MGTCEVVQKMMVSAVLTFIGYKITDIHPGPEETIEIKVFFIFQLLCNLAKEIKYRYRHSDFFSKITKKMFGALPPCRFCCSSTLIFDTMAEKFCDF